MKKLSFLLLAAMLLVIGCKKKPTEEPFLRFMQNSLQLAPTP